jgi:hypothetical protein
VLCKQTGRCVYGRKVCSLHNALRNRIKYSYICFIIIDRIKDRNVVLCIAEIRDRSIETMQLRASGIKTPTSTHRDKKTADPLTVPTGG